MVKPSADHEERVVLNTLASAPYGPHQLEIIAGETAKWRRRWEGPYGENRTREILRRLCAKAEVRRHAGAYGRVRYGITDTGRHRIGRPKGRT